MTITEQGLPIIIPKLEFGDSPPEEARFIPHHEALGLLDRCLAEIPLTLWLVMDRLDEAFAGTPAAEVPALRALLRCYLDLLNSRMFVSSCSCATTSFGGSSRVDS